MATYEHDGLRLHYEDVGRGPSVLCVHGATGTAAYEWSDLTTVLSARYRCVSPDLRGHGRSEHAPGRVGIEFVNADLLALIEHEHLGRPHVVAFSFGAEAALELELTFPGTSRSLTLISPGLADPAARLPTLKQLEVGWPRSLRSLHVARHGEDHWLEVMLEICERSAARPKTDLAAVAAITCPVLLIVGSDDDPRRTRDASVLEATNPRCEVVTIEGARHAVHKDRPVEVAAAVGDFLDGVTR
jgi:3-oxoadipate enol-lactonase